MDLRVITNLLTLMNDFGIESTSVTSELVNYLLGMHLYNQVSHQTLLGCLNMLYWAVIMKYLLSVITGLFWVPIKYLLLFIRSYNSISFISRYWAVIIKYLSSDVAWLFEYLSSDVTGLFEYPRVNISETPFAEPSLVHLWGQVSPWLPLILHIFCNDSCSVLFAEVLLLVVRSRSA